MMSSIRVLSKGHRIWSIVLGWLFVAACVAGCHGYGTPSEVDPPVTVSEMSGVWRSITGATMELGMDGHLEIRNIPNDILQTNGYPGYVTDVTGNWYLCPQADMVSPIDCDVSVVDNGVSVYFTYVMKYTVEVDPPSTVDLRIILTGSPGDRVMWFYSGDIYDSDPRCRFTEEGL